MIRIIAGLLVFALLVVPVYAQTAEVQPASTVEAKTPNFWAEFDITFWQTIPFMAFWGYVAANQVSKGGEINWHQVVNFTLGISVLNAFMHAKKVASK